MAPFLFLTLLLSFPLLWASPYCATVHKLDSMVEWRQKSNQLFRDKMLGQQNQGEKELYFYWHTANAFNLQKIDDSRYMAVPSQKRMRIYRNHTDLEAANPLEIVNTFLARQDTSNAEMLKAFIQNYKGRTSETIIQAIKDLESLMANLANERQSFGYVATAPASHGGEMLATMRVYNGSSQQNGRQAEKNARAKSSSFDF